MKEISKILLYLIGTLLLGAVLAPPLYWLGNAVGSDHFMTFLDETPFQRYFNRAMLIAAVVLLYPFIKWLDPRDLRSATMQPDPHRWRNLFFGLAVSVALMAILGAILVAMDYYKIKDEFPWRKIRKVPLTAAGASIAEEFLFRGAILALALRAGSKWTALTFTAALYSIVHFLKSKDEVFADRAVGWLSGFELLPHSFWQFRDPLLLGGGFTTLFALGLILGYAALATRSLWLPIGLHAGMILGKFEFTKIAKRRGEPSIWIGDHLEVGLVALAMMVVLGTLVWLWCRYVVERDPAPVD